MNFGKGKGKKPDKPKMTFNEEVDQARRASTAQNGYRMGKQVRHGQGR